MMGSDPRLKPVVELGALETSLGFLLRIAQLKIFEDFYARFGDQGPRPGEFSVLWVIAQNPGIKQGLVAETLHIKPAHMTKIVRRYEEQGLVTRDIPDHDRRSVNLSLTATGQAYVEDMRPVFFGSASYHDNPLSVAETRDLTRLLRKYAGLDDFAVTTDAGATGRARSGE